MDGAINEGNKFLEMAKKYWPILVVIIGASLFSWSQITKTKRATDQLKQSEMSRTKAVIDLNVATKKIEDLQTTVNTQSNTLKNMTKDSFENAKEYYETGVVKSERSSGSKEASLQTEQLYETLVQQQNTEIQELTKQRDDIKGEYASALEEFKTLTEKESKSRGGFGFDFGPELRPGHVDLSCGAHYTVFQILGFDLTLKAGYAVVPSL